MTCNNKELIEKVEYWEQLVSDSKLPTWDELPTLELYMDQIIVLINNYLSYIASITGDEKNVTPAMINNYVKMKVIPPPVKKKYSRIHLACLIMVCSLKKCLNISTVQKLLPKTDDIAHVKMVYNSFVENRRISIENAKTQITESVTPILKGGEMADVCNLITRVAVTADLHKLFTEKFTETIFEKKAEPEKEKPPKKKEEK